MQTKLSGRGAGKRESVRRNVAESGSLYSLVAMKHDERTIVYRTSVALIAVELVDLPGEPRRIVVEPIRIPEPSPRPSRPDDPPEHAPQPSPEPEPVKAAAGA